MQPGSNGAAPNHLEDRLKPDPDSGKPKILQDRTVQNLNEWLSLFEGRNVTNDEELSALVEQCRAAMAGADTTTLRKDQQYREELSSNLGRIKEQLGTLVIDRPQRRFAWDDAA